MKASAGNLAPIVQHRSGKSRAPERRIPRVVDSRTGVLPFSEEPGRSAIFLESGKHEARALAVAFAGESRLAFARIFCAEVVRTYWIETQRRYRDPWPLPAAGLPAGRRLDEPALSLARRMGLAGAGLDPCTASYLIGVLYTATIPEETRSRWGSYYTPPGLTRRLLELATEAGVDWNRCRVIDPACGGGAFLAPVAAKIASASAHRPARRVVRAIGERLRGFEVDPFAAWTSQVFLEVAVMEVCRQAGERLPSVVGIGDSLLTSAAEQYDLVIGNPPYGRVTLNREVRERYRRSLYGHANLYGLFTDLAVQLTRPGGVIAYVTPTSFLAGEYFKSLRHLLAAEAPPASLDFVSVRKGVFDDALQETLLATYRRGNRNEGATVHFISPTGYSEIAVEPAGRFSLPNPAGSPWLVPRDSGQERLIAVLRRMPHRLRDYGYKVNTGPLVWNRHKGQLARHPSAAALPLIWAECVTADGTFVFRAAKKNHEPYFRPEPGDDWLICRKPCVLLQRTTAKEQSRRLIAAELPGKFLRLHPAVVIENHLNMIRPANGEPCVAPRVLCALLNSEIIDKAFRCFSGSVAVSAYELEALPLPPPETLAKVTELVEEKASREVVERACAKLFDA
jgi:adenine-specific DNA-methyltransferase